MKQSFTAFEYHADARFYPAEYRYEGSERSGWVIFRNGQHYLTLPPGFLLLKTLCCGICSTDIARHNLPFPLPQITGHEVVALHDGINVVVDINAAHKHTGDEFYCEYCSANLENHCPDRLTLGIDRLPGGFSPYLLVPKKAIVRLPDNIDMRLASVIEPFAAALHAVNVETIQAGDSVGIVGPRRLGSLLILALSLWRKKTSIDFKIIAITRSEQVRTLCELAGADEIVDASNVQSLACDVVFDTSGSTSGFELSLQVAKRVVHVKSTNGLEVFGFQHLTEMVINEFSLLSLQLSSSDADDSEITSLFKAVDHPRILVDDSFSGKELNALRKKFPDVIEVVRLRKCIGKVGRELNQRFDAAIGLSVSFLNAATEINNGHSYLKPKGILFLVSGEPNSPLLSALNKGVTIHTSRCGSFLEAINMFQGNENEIEPFLNVFVSATYSADILPEAFEKASSDKSSIKVLIKHGL